MRVLIFESSSGLSEIDPRLLPEGFAMLKTMVDQFSEAGFEVCTVLNKGLKRFGGWFEADVCYDRGLDRVKPSPDLALVIAPEPELAKIILKLQKKGTRVLGPAEESVRIAGDKWLTHLALEGKVPQPRTSTKPSEIPGQVLVKPVWGVGCEGIEFLSRARSDRVIFQEFVKGEHASCCILMNGREGEVISVNKQEIRVSRGRFRYSGSEIPLRHERAEECAEIALESAKDLNLRGFCGVDLVLGEAPFFIELNPRVTTSFIALPRVLEVNLGELLIDTLIDGEPTSRPKLRGHSLVRILRAKRDIEVGANGFDDLRGLTGIVAPPLALDGCIKKGSTMFVAVGVGASAARAERDLRRTVLEACTLLGVEADAIAWA